MKENKKPRCKLVETDGNVFALIGRVSKTLKKAGMSAEASEMQRRCFKAGSYDEALGIIIEYVDAY